MLAVGGSWRAGHLATIDVVSTRAGPMDDAAPERGATRWPGFRGGRDTNVSRAARLPLTWSDASVTWRVTAPGFGQSSPVIWDDTVFLTSLEGAMKETIFITAIGLDDGAERWRRTCDAAEAFEWNDYVSKGAPTPAVDGERLYALFDSGDLLALTHDGKTVWRRRLGAEYGSVVGNHGVGNSVLLTDRAVVVVLLTRRTYSYLLAVDPATGETLWKADREPGVAWSTPVLAPGGEEIVVSASGRDRGVRSGHRRADLVLQGSAGEPRAFAHGHGGPCHRRRHVRPGQPRSAPRPHRRPQSQRRGLDGRLRVQLCLAPRLSRVHLLGDPGGGRPLPRAGVRRCPLDPIGCPRRPGRRRSATTTTSTSSLRKASRRCCGPRPKRHK